MGTTAEENQDRLPYLIPSFQPPPSAKAVTHEPRSSNGIPLAMMNVRHEGITYRPFLLQSTSKSAWSLICHYTMARVRFSQD